MEQQILVTVEIKPESYDLVERYAAEQGRTAADVVEDSLRLYAERGQAFRAMGDALQQSQEEAIRNGTSTMTMEEINEEIAAYRAENAALCAS